MGYAFVNYLGARIYVLTATNLRTSYLSVHLLLKVEAHPTLVTPGDR